MGRFCGSSILTRGESVFCTMFAGPGVGLDLDKAFNLFAGFDWSSGMT